MSQVASPNGNHYDASQPLFDSVEKSWSWVGSADMQEDLWYEFNEVAVFRHNRTGDLLAAWDTGCSCPIPFEETVVNDGTFLASLKDFDEYIDEILPGDRGPHVTDQVVALRKQVEVLLG